MTQPDVVFWHPWFALLVTAGVFIGLQLKRSAPTDLLFLFAAALMALAGIITPEQAFGGFANTAVLTIGALLVVAEGLKRTGVLDLIGHALLGKATTERAALLRLAPTLVATSAFLLNTALVAMMAPVVVDWCRRRRVSPSKLLIPLSYLSILGGVCTLVGTSTTLIANGELRSQHEKRVVAAQEAFDKTGDAVAFAAAQRFLREAEPLEFFEIGYVGLPCALIGTGLLVLFGPRLLPNRTDMLEQLGEQRREYLVEMLVKPECPLIGQSVQQAGLRHLEGLFLIEIDRDGEVLTPVTPHEVIHVGDRLVFTGVVSTIVDLEKINGLVPAADMSYEFQPQNRHRRVLTEVVLSRTSPLIGRTIRDANFRQLYNAAVVAVHRNGVRLSNKVGDIALQPGDTLLLQTRDKFVETYRNSRDFYLVSGVSGWQPRLHHKTKLAGALIILLIAWLVIGSWPSVPPAVRLGLGAPPVAAVTIACLMIIFGCLKVPHARQALDLRVLITIAGALGLGRALDESQANDMIANSLISVLGSDPYVLLIAVYLLTMLLTEMISNNAVAALMLPFALDIAMKSGHSPRPFVIAITVVASLSFVTPIGYQTNLMVMGPGGYRPLDYARCGTPLAIAVGITALVLIPWIWGFGLS